MTEPSTSLIKSERPPVAGHISYKTQEALIIQGDLAGLTPEQRVQYCVSLCQKLGLNYLTRPFDYIVLNGKLTLYARKDATDQLRTLHKINLGKPTREIDKDLGVCIVTVEAELPDGRKDAATGVTGISVMVDDEQVVDGKKVKCRKRIPVLGDELANAIMRAETKAKRRVTLSICGLGFLDESEIETVSKGQVTVIAKADKGKLDEIRALIDKTGAKLDKHLERFGVATMETLNVRQAEDLLAFLEAVNKGL